MARPAVLDTPPEEFADSSVAPAWFSRVPAAAWLFVVLVAGYAWFRLSTGSASTFPRDWFQFAVSLVEPAAYLLLPAAVLIGPATGVARRALLYGALSLAAIELVGVARDLISGPAALAGGGAGASGASGGADVLAVVPFVIALLAVAGPAFLALGVRWSRPASDPGWRPAARRVFAVAAIVTLAGLTATIYSIATYPWDDVLASTYVGPLDLVAGLVAALSTLTWGWFAAETVELRRPGWRSDATLVIAALVVFGSRAVVAALAAAGAVTVAVRGDLAFAFPVVEWASWTILAGLIALVVALAVAPRMRLSDGN